MHWTNWTTLNLMAARLDLLRKAAEVVDPEVAVAVHLADLLRDPDLVPAPDPVPNPGLVLPQAGAVLDPEDHVNWTTVRHFLEQPNMC